VSDFDAPAPDDIPDVPPSGQWVADRRAELEMELEHMTLGAEYAEAKLTRDDDPERYTAAKAAFTDHRTYWRRIGEAAGTRTPVTSISATMTPQEG
jgi:hypothetical protein